MTEKKLNPEDTGQISVAELLARNGKKTDPVAGGRRRRGVKGGISVAELTGEIPVIRADPEPVKAPAIEAEKPYTATPSQPQYQAPQYQAPQYQAPQSQPQKPHVEPELLSGSTTAAADLLNQAHDEHARRPQGSVYPTPSTSSRRENESTGRPQRSSGFVSRNRAKPVDDEPKTDLMPAFTEKADSPQTPEALQTPEVPRKRGVPRKPEVPWKRTSSASSGKAESQVQPETQGMQMGDAPDLTKKVVSPASESQPSAKPHSVAKPQRIHAKPAVETGDAVKNSPSESGTDDEASADDRAAKQEATKQWMALAGQAAIAIIVGALLFKGFERLWDMLPWVALVLSVLVIVGLVAVVRILRRTDDLISMVIAIAVGVFVTLGPLAFQLSTG